MDRHAKANVLPVRQRTQYSCMACSLAMAIKANGLDTNEDQVNEVMGAVPMRGASWEQSFAAAQHFGMRVTFICPATLGQIKKYTDQGVPVMIAWNPEGRPWSHASVIFDVTDEGEVFVADPNIPDPEETVRVVSKAEFYGKWYEKFPDYLVRRPAMAVEREISATGQQRVAAVTGAQRLDTVTALIIKALKTLGYNNITKFRTPWGVNFRSIGPKSIYRGTELGSTWDKEDVLKALSKIPGFQKSQYQDRYFIPFPVDQNTEQVAYFKVNLSGPKSTWEPSFSIGVIDIEYVGTMDGSPLWTKLLQDQGVKFAGDSFSPRACTAKKKGPQTVTEKKKKEDLSFTVEVGAPRNAPAKALSERGTGGSHHNRDYDVAHGKTRKDKHKKDWREKEASSSLTATKLPGKGDYALVQTRGLNDVVFSLHATKEDAEKAMRKRGGEPDSMITKGMRVVNVGPKGQMELLEISGKWTLRPRGKKAAQPLSLRPDYGSPNSFAGSVNEAYEGNPDGEPIYNRKIDHGYDVPVAGGTDVMQQLQKNLLREQGRAKRLAQRYITKEA